MQFTSLTFVVFLTIVFSLYWFVRRPRLQNAVIVIASYMFYGWWDYRFCALILFSSLVDYFLSRQIDRSNDASRRKTLLTISLASNLGLLALFKYYGFFADNFLALAQSFGWTPNDLTLNLILPVGISFYTFQTMSYTIDVYRRQLKPADHLVDYLAFVSFFPQLVAGPIERGTNLLPQFEKPRLFNVADASDGCRLILWGFFKKLAVADLLATTVDQHFNHWETATGAELALATVFFAFQIYCDFSAYSDIAIGTARLFSIRLMRNFAYPYFSQSFTEFWSRWHISLSTWFRDYVYIPLGGNRVSIGRQKLNIFLTFILSGFWHGAAWTFIAWGVIHGTALVIQKQFSRTSSTKPAIDFAHAPQFFLPPVIALKMVLTFTFVCLGWVFFRADNISSAFAIVGKVMSEAWQPQHLGSLMEAISSEKPLKTSLLVLMIFMLVEWTQRHLECPLTALTLGRFWIRPVRWVAYSMVILATLDLVSRTDAKTFIYFAF